MRKSGSLVFLAALLLSVEAHGSKVDENYDPLAGFVKWQSSRTLDLTDVFSVVENAAKISVFEGLPHQVFETKAFRREAERPDVYWVKGVPFYQRQLTVPAEDLKLLTEIYSSKKSHEKKSGIKLCGGFHPDYYVVWRSGNNWVGVMICLGCAEWISLNSDGYRYEDVSRGAYERLRKILEKYVSQRPPEGESEEVRDLPTKEETIK